MKTINQLENELIGIRDNTKKFITKKTTNISIFLIIGGYLIWGYFLYETLSNFNWFVLCATIITFVLTTLHLDWLNKKLIEKHNYYLGDKNSKLV